MIIILSSPSGGGKSSIADKLVTIDDNIIKSISVTTRTPRPQEQEGRDYFFISKEQLSQQDLIESAKIYGNFYGTPKKFVIEQLKKGKDVLFDIDWQGAKQIIARMPHVKILTIFLMPPSMQELEKRLRARNQDDNQAIQRRLKSAVLEISNNKYYNHVLVNDDFDKTVLQILTLIKQYRNLSTV
ncbi:MAG: guanylate kinase [Rickettsiaceae bacterium]|nr:guanylate kinase [Rickettsiaceae bacterium]